MIDLDEARELSWLACQPSHVLARTIVALRQQVDRLRAPWPELESDAACPSCGARLAGPHPGDPPLSDDPFLPSDEDTMEAVDPRD